MFSFGAKKEEKEEEKKPAFTFSFGAKKEEETKPAFTFSFGAAKKDEEKPAEDKKDEEKPAEDKKDENKPAFSFHFNPSNSNPAFTFTPNAKPAFNIPAAPKEETAKPAPETQEDDDDTMEGQKGVTVLHSVRAKLYAARNGAWESQGVGTFRIEEFM